MCRSGNRCAGDRPPPTRRPARLMHARPSEAARPPPEVSTMFEKLREIRDVARLDAHLARMELHKRWECIEPRLQDASRVGDEVATIALKAMGEIWEVVHRHQ